jgi:hypothetical protein
LGVAEESPADAAEEEEVAAIEGEESAPTETEPAEDDVGVAEESPVDAADEEEAVEEAAAAVESITGEETPEEAETPAEEVVRSTKVGSLEGMQGGGFPELADMDITDPMYTRTLARLYEEQGHYKEALTTYGMILKENPDDEDIQQKITEMEQLQSFQQEFAGDDSTLGALLSEEEPQAVAEEADVPEEEVVRDEPVAADEPDLEEETAAQVDVSEGETESGPDLLDVTEDAEVEEPGIAEPAAGADDFDLESELKESLIEEPPGSPEESVLGEETPAAPLVEEASADLVEPVEEAPEAGEADGPEAAAGTGPEDYLSDLDDIASDLEETPGDETVPDVAAPEEASAPQPQESSPPPDPTPAEVADEQAEAPTPEKEQTIRRLEGLLDRVRGKSQEGESS